MSRPLRDPAARSIRGFADALARCRVAPNACNQYAGSSRGAAMRRENLVLYLQQMRERRPELLLVGEAPSHRGCRLTGIPFMSETILLRGVTEAEMFGTTRGYRKATTGEQRSTEASATMVWSTIAHLEPLPLLWNAFPFHPHRPGEPWSNRAPTDQELELGERFVIALAALFGIETLVAVGNRARDSLVQLGLSHVRVRHPSRGGKREFAAGVLQLCQNHQGEILGGTP